MLGVEQRLLTESIARNEELLPPAVGERKREHATEARRQIGSPLAVPMEQDFRI